MKKQVEDRLKFYESGEAPRKNIDVMKEAIQVCLKIRVIFQLKLNSLFRLTISSKLKKPPKRKRRRIRNARQRMLMRQTALEILRQMCQFWMSQTGNQRRRRRKSLKKMMIQSKIHKLTNQSNSSIFRKTEIPRKKRKRRRTRKLTSKLASTLHFF